MSAPRRLSSQRFAWWMSAQIALLDLGVDHLEPPTYLEANPDRAQLAQVRYDVWTRRSWWRCDACGIPAEHGEWATVRFAAGRHNLRRHPRRSRARWRR